MVYNGIYTYNIWYIRIYIYIYTYIYIYIHTHTRNVEIFSVAHLICFDPLFFVANLLLGTVMPLLGLGKFSRGDL